MILWAEMHIAYRGRESLALLVLLDHVRREERSGFRYHARPDRKRHVRVVGAPFRTIVVLLVEGIDEHFRQRIFVLQRPPEIGGGIDAFGQFRTDFLGDKRYLIRND